MAKKSNYGTLSTKSSSDNKARAPKLKEVPSKMKHLLGLNKVRVHPHANKRMGERGVIYFEVLQVLGKSVYEPKKDRYNDECQSWEYSFLGYTVDKRRLRVGVAFELDPKRSERLLIITVIDLGKEDV